MENNQLQVILKEQNVAKENADELLKAFGAPFTEAGVILVDYKSIVVTKEDQFDLMADARTKRLALKNIRVEVEKKRKELKENSLRTGRAIDSVAKYVKDTIEPAEEYLDLQEKFGEIKAAEKAAKIKLDRIEKLMQYTDDISLYNLDGMSDEQFESLLAGIKSQHEAKLADEKRIEDERIAQEKAAIVEQERIKIENESLRKEAEAKEVEREIERKAEADQQAKIQAVADKARIAAQVELDKERAKLETIEAEQKARDDADKKAQIEKDDAERRALLSPDKDKLITFAQAIDTIRLTKLPVVKSKQAQVIVDEIDADLTALYTKITSGAKGL